MSLNCPFPLGSGLARALRTFGGKASEAAARPPAAVAEPSRRRRVMPVSSGFLGDLLIRVLSSAAPAVQAALTVRSDTAKIVTLRLRLARPPANIRGGQPAAEARLVGCLQVAMKLATQASHHN
jgi:hypothetical protein